MCLGAVYNNSTMTARHRTGCWKILFQLKSHRVNVPFNKDNFVDSYFLHALSLSLYVSHSLSHHNHSRGSACYLPFVAFCFWLIAIKHTEKYKIMYLYERMCRAEQFSSQFVKAKQTNKFFSCFFPFHNLLTLITRHYSKSVSAAMKGFCRLKFH